MRLSIGVTIEMSSGHGGPSSINITERKLMAKLADQLSQCQECHCKRERAERLLLGSACCFFLRSFDERSRMSSSSLSLSAAPSGENGSDDVP